MQQLGVMLRHIREKKDLFQAAVSANVMDTYTDGVTVEL